MAVESVDNIVRKAIGDLFPDQIIPDEDNYLPDRSQFKAPDHAILGGSVLIERKSRNAIDDSKIYQKLREIADSQGDPFRGYGRINAGQIIKSLPDPTNANRKIADYTLNQMMKAVRKARHQFEEYVDHVERSDQLKIFLGSDNTDITESTAYAEQFFGRKMGGYDKGQDETGLINAIIYIKHPRFVFDERDSYWFKCLIKRRLNSDERKLLNQLAAALHDSLARHPSLLPDVQKFEIGYYRSLLV